MKKLNLKDLQLSPKVVTYLSGSSAGKSDYTDGCTGTDTCNQSVADGCISNNDQCLSEADNPCATEVGGCTGEACLKTLKETCLCTNLCALTRSQDVKCCQLTNDVNTQCCLTPPESKEVCPETEDGFHCALTDICLETANCMEPNES